MKKELGADLLAETEAKMLAAQAAVVEALAVAYPAATPEDTHDEAVEASVEMLRAAEAGERLPRYESFMQRPEFARFKEAYETYSKLGGSLKAYDPTSVN